MPNVICVCSLCVKCRVTVDGLEVPGPGRSVAASTRRKHEESDKIKQQKAAWASSAHRDLSLHSSSRPVRKPKAKNIREQNIIILLVVFETYGALQKFGFKTPPC